MLPDIKIKDEVTINGAHFYPEMFFILHVARITAPALTDNTVWVTSANDGKHMDGSLHYGNKAFDIRTRNVEGGLEYQKIWTRSIKKHLGKDFDIVFGIGTDNSKPSALMLKELESDNPNMAAIRRDNLTKIRPHLIDKAA